MMNDSRSAKNSFALDSVDALRLRRQSPKRNTRAHVYVVTTAWPACFCWRSVAHCHSAQRTTTPGFYSRALGPPRLCSEKALIEAICACSAFAWGYLCHLTIQTCVILSAMPAMSSHYALVCILFAFEFLRPKCHAGCRRSVRAVMTGCQSIVKHIGIGDLPNIHMLVRCIAAAKLLVRW